MTLKISGSAPRRTTPAWIATALAAVIASAVVAVTPTRAHAIATPVPLGTAASFAVLAGSEITNTGPTVITGDLGVSPGTAISGFPPGIVNGTIHSGPVDPVGLQAKNDLVVAYNNAAGQSTDAILPPDAGGLTLVPGVYTAPSTLGLTGTLTLDAQGDPNAVWVFQVGSSLTTASSSSVSLINGGSPCNVFWQIGSSATLGTETDFIGTIMALTSISLTTGADIDGRALARNGAVTMDTNVINRGSCAAGTTGGTTGGLVTGGVIAGTTTGGATTGSPTTGGTTTGGLLGGVLGGATTGGANGGLLGGVLGGVTTGGGLIAGTTTSGVTGATTGGINGGATGGINGGATGGIPKPPDLPKPPGKPGHGDHGGPDDGHPEGPDHGNHEGPGHGNHEGPGHGQPEPGHGDGDQSDGWNG
ncbi:ice-binding family protein, partial [Streptomyces sp. NRRL F-2664]|uniref:ice-binding family protein n=1 Tax=Streptomyces sp. NRRL F-2664 TaxID=1463842 RepID=UPI0004C9FBCC